jgi:hypothetical protein
MAETLLSTSNVLLFGRKVEDLQIDHTKEHNPGARKGKNSLLRDQFTPEEGTGASKEKIACFARIYGFSYEGTYFDLPRPMLFLVHGAGEKVVLPSKGGGGATDANLARAPQEPSLSGVGAAEFQLADDIRVWSYDKADYTIRMDVETGMFEQVLLDMVFDGGGGVSGARVSGARVAGARVAGARVSGARVSGARVGGPRGDASD